MISKLPNITKLNNFKYINQLQNHTLTFTLVQSLLFHSFFFLYRNTFFEKNIKLIGSKATELQLTYMDTAWEELNLKKIYLRKAKKPMKDLKLITYLFKTNRIKFTKTKILKMLVYFLRRTPTAYIDNKIYSKYLNSYSSFLHSRTDLSKHSYFQSFQTWFVNIYKKPNLSVHASTSHTKLRFIRRLKIRDIGKLEQNREYKTVNSNFNNKLFKSKPLNLYIGDHITYLHKNLKPSLKFKKYCVREIYSKGHRRGKRNTGTSNFKYKFFDKQILKRYDLHCRFTNNPSLKHNSVKLFSMKKKTRQFKKETLESLRMLHLKSLQSVKNYSNNSEPSLFINSNFFNSFILRNSGLFILSKFSLSNKFPYKLKSQFKKKLFSFIYPGQSKKNVLLRRKKQVLTRLLSNSFKVIKSLDRFSYQLYYQLFNTEAYNISKHKLYNKLETHNNLTFDLNLRSIYYSFDYQTKGVDVSDLYIHSEVRIPRVRFKPGYQRIWRQVRSALQIALNVRFQYQKQLTKYLIKFYHLSSQYLLSYSESTLEKIVVYSHLLPDISTTKLFSFNGFLYLNGTVTNSLSSIVIKNDLIQLVVSLWYYIITRWFSNWTDNRIRKFKRLVYRKNKPLQYKVMKTKKQQSYYTPNWIYQTRYDNSDIKPYLEVDFFTLSSFVITDTYIQYYHKIDDMPDLRNSTYMLYNWKYIT